MSMIIGPVLGGLTILVLVALPYVVFERRHRSAWRKLAMRQSTARGGPYRRSVVGVDFPKRAPLIVRFAALSSFFIGSACVPLATMAFATLVAGEAWVLAVLLPPAVVLARLWIAGAHLLDPDVDALQSVRNAARGLVHLSLPVFLASVPLWLLLSIATQDGAELLVALGIASLFGLGHSRLLARATTSAAHVLPEEAERRVLVTRTIPSWMYKVLQRKLQSS
jgi:hypothetical protein